MVEWNCCIINPKTDEKQTGALWGTFIGDAIAMPVHWYYDRAALHRDYGIVLAGGGLREALFEQRSDWLSQRTAEQWSRVYT